MKTYYLLSSLPWAACCEENEYAKFKVEALSKLMVSNGPKATAVGIGKEQIPGQSQDNHGIRDTKEWQRGSHSCREGRF